MNYAQKHSGMSAKPNHSLKNAAKGMNNHAELRFYEKKHTLWSSCTATPLYFKEGCGHNISVMKKIQSVAQHFLKNQFSCEYILPI